MKYRILTGLLALCLVFSLLPAAAAAQGPTQDEVYYAIAALKKDYPEGTPWGDYEYYEWNGGVYTGGYGCVAFAFMLSDAAFGTLPARKVGKVTFADVRPGDILRMEGDTHSVIVLKKYADYLTIAEGNYNGSVHWGRVLTASEVEGADFLLTRYPKDSTPTPPVDDPNPPSQDIIAFGDCGQYGWPNVKWSLSKNGLLSITGSGSVENYNTISTAPWYSYAGSITRAVVGEGMTVLASAAFYNCTALTQVTLPSTLETIGNDAFAGCAALQTLTLPGGLKSIGSRAFQGCTALQVVEFPNSLTSIGNNTFQRSGIRKAQLPQGLTYLGSNAFENCDALTVANIPGTVTNNIQYTFQGCDSLEKVTLGNGLTAVGRYVFAGCGALKEVVFPATLLEIGEHAFEATGLQKLALPQGITTLGDNAFASSALTEVAVPNSVTAFGSGVFSYCPSLHTVRLAEGITSIGTATFQRCEELTNVTLPGTLQALGVYTFANTGLVSLTIPEGVAAIHKYAFEYSGSLYSITIPTTVTSIGDGAFDRCENLRDVHYAGTQEQWDAIQVGSANFILDSANIHFSSQGACQHLTVTVQAGKNATCDARGLTEGQTCAECGQVLAEQKPIPALGHAYEQGVCTRCGAQEATVELGDVNGDGKINVTDAMVALRYAVKKITRDELVPEAADVNGDGKINVTDAMQILRYAVKKITSFTKA